MKRLLLAGALLLFAVSAQAQNATVVTTCGTLPQTYAPGSTRQVTVDINGNLCSGDITALGTPADAAYTGSGSATVISALKGIYSAITGALAAGTNYIGQIGLSTLQSGAQATVIQCDSHAVYDASDNGSITLVTGVSNKKIYVCGLLMATGGTATNLKLVGGTNANCASGGYNLTPAYQLVANDRAGFYGAYATGIKSTANGDYMCINASAGNAHQAEIWYTIQ
jgi:hypothetical protein